MTTNILQHKCCYNYCNFLFFNEVSHVRKACLPPSLLQPLQSVCQPSFIQPEIFLSVGSLLSLNGTPPQIPPPLPQEGRTFHYLSSWHPALSSTVHHREIYWIWMVTPAPGFCAAPLTSECFQSCVMNVQASLPSINPPIQPFFPKFIRKFLVEKATHQRSSPGCERTPIRAHFWLKLSRGIDCKRN